MASDDEVWERMRRNAPLCDCGQRLSPGGITDTPMLVCTGCGTVQVVDPGWAEQFAAEARAQIDAEGADQ